MKTSGPKNSKGRNHLSLYLSPTPSVWHYILTLLLSSQNLRFLSQRQTDTQTHTHTHTHTRARTNVGSVIAVFGLRGSGVLGAEEMNTTHLFTSSLLLFFLSFCHSFSGGFSGEF